MKNPIFVALDVDTEREALRIADMTGSYVGGFKVGPRLAVRFGATLLPELAKRAPLFIDNKYFDIPSTMEGAVRASFEMGASYVTIHAQAGVEALKRMAEVEAELNRQRPFKILAVTVLTSFSALTLPEVLKAIPIEEMVMSLARLAVDSGLSGLVCAPQEVSALRRKFSSAFLLVPGIRIDDVSSDDQKRSAGPAEAMKNGATALVVGRPIYQASDPAGAAKRFFHAVVSK